MRAIQFAAFAAGVLIAPGLCPAQSQLTINDLLVVKAQIERCWNLPAGTEGFTPEFRIFMNKDGTVKSVEQLNDALAPGFKAAAEAALQAIRDPRCQPYNFPASAYPQWQTFTITFDAKDAVQTSEDQQTYTRNAQEQARVQADKPVNQHARSLLSAHAEKTCPKDVFEVGMPETAVAREYLDSVRLRLARFKRYPAAAQQAQQQGHLVVGFTVLHDGRVTHARILQSSHFPLLDEAALRMLRDASPLPSLPCSAKKVTVSLPVDFALPQQPETQEQRNARDFPCVFTLACGSEGAFALLETTHLATQDLEKQLWGYALADQVKIIRTFDTRAHCLEAKKEYTQYRSRLTSGTREDVVAVVTYTCALPPAWQEIDR